MRACPRSSQRSSSSSGSRVLLLAATHWTAGAKARERRGCTRGGAALLSPGNFTIAPRARPADDNYFRRRRRRRRLIELAHAIQPNRCGRADRLRPLCRPDRGPASSGRGPALGSGGRLLRGGRAELAAGEVGANEALRCVRNRLGAPTTCGRRKGATLKRSARGTRASGRAGERGQRKTTGNRLPADPVSWSAHCRDSISLMSGRLARSPRVACRGKAREREKKQEPAAGGGHQQTSGA